MSEIIKIEWAQFICGDNEALGQVYKAHHASMLFTAYYLVKNKDIAKDLVADVFTKLLGLTLSERQEKLGEVNEKLESFLKVLVKNRSLDLLKVESNRNSIITSIFGQSSRSINNHAFVAEDFLKMMEVLPHRQQEVLQLHMEGYSNDEIAQKLGITYNTCRNTLSSAKKKVKNIWQIFMT